MGESYLQRKVLNRIIKRTPSRQQQHQTSIKQPVLTQPTAKTLCSSPPCVVVAGSSSSGGDNSETTSLTTGACCDPNETVVASNSQKRHSKLKSASRAIQFFRRAAGGKENQQAQRQQTSLWPPAGINSSNSAGRLTLASSGSSAYSHSQESQRSGASLGSGPNTNITPTSGQSQRSTTKATTAPNPPQFIVPKMNALRLPLVCRIRSLEGELMREVFVHRYEEGKYLIESLKVSLGLQDDKYFGLKMARSSDDQEDLRNAWLTLADSVCKQLKGRHQYQQRWSSFRKQTPKGFSETSSQGPRAVDFYLRIKFYPPNLGRVQDQFLRNYLWLQLRRDLRLGKLISSANNLCQLMACVCQWELGDYRAELVPKLSELNILPNQDLIEERAVEVWRTRLVGLQRHQAQMQFLRAAVILETYGFDYYQVRDHQRQRQYLLGFNYAGVKTIRNGRIVHHFTWHSMSKISLENRMIIFHIYPTENSKRKQVLGFKCLSQEECKSLYMRLLEQKYFFTIELAYFDKSVRRPSCLYSSGNSSSANQLLVGASNGDLHNPPANVTASTSTVALNTSNPNSSWCTHQGGNSGQSSQDLGDSQVQTTSNATRYTSCGPSLERDRSTDSSLAANLAPAVSDCSCRLNSSSMSPASTTLTCLNRPVGDSQTARSMAAGRLKRQQATLQYLGQSNGSEEADEEDELEEENSLDTPNRREYYNMEQCWRLASERLWSWTSYIQNFQPAARLCGSLVMMSLLLRCTESMSSYLLDLISPSDSSSSSSTSTS